MAAEAAPHAVTVRETPTLQKYMNNVGWIKLRNNHEEQLAMFVTTDDTTGTIGTDMFRPLKPGRTTACRVFVDLQGWKTAPDHVTVIANFCLYNDSKVHLDPVFINVKLIAEAEVEALEDDLNRCSELLCGICDLAYSEEVEHRTPRLLGCGHTICQRCARQLIRHLSKLEDGTLKCPFDRIDTVIKRGNTEVNLPKNFFVVDLLNYFKRSGTLDCALVVAREQPDASEASDGVEEIITSFDQVLKTYP